MRKIIILLTIAVMSGAINVSGQKVYKDYLDGQIYLKIKNNVPYIFDNQQSVSISEKLPFLIPFIVKYKITKVESSFYFSKSELLRRTFRIYFDDIRVVDKFLANLKSVEQTEYAEKIPLISLSYTPNDLGTNSTNGQYGLYNIHAQEAWDVTRGSSAIKIAIVDNAVDISHSDLSGKGSSNWDVADNDNDPTPPRNSMDHGTHCAGIATAKTNNGNGISSISWNCSLMGIKCTSNSNPSDISVQYGYEGIAWASSHGANVISCSWGGSGCTSCQTVIDDAYNSNAIVVVAAGNDNNNVITYPAGYNHVLSVAAVDINDKRASFSTYGSWVKVSAPGVSIRSTLPGNIYGNFSGTSMACPLVAGLCGLIKSLNPSLSYDNVVNCVVSTADNIDAQNPGYVGQLGSGRINAYRAVECNLTCNGSLNLGTASFSVLKTESSGSITTSNTIPVNSRVILDAATSVSIKPGFFAIEGSAFHAYIDGCGGAKSSGSAKVMAISPEKETVETGNMKLFPNPFSKTFIIDILSKEATAAQVNVYNEIGVLMKANKTINLNKGRNQITVDGSAFSPGMYMVEIITGDAKTVRKVVKL